MWNGHHDVVQTLVGAGADVNYSNISRVMFSYKYMYSLTSYCKVHALFINVLYTGHIFVHMHISYVLGCVLRGGAGGGIGLKRIVSVCNIIGHQEVVLWAPTFPTHLDPPSSYHQLVEEWGWGGGGPNCVVCTYAHYQ